jgi:hypothetical protein
LGNTRTDATDIATLCGLAHRGDERTSESDALTQLNDNGITPDHYPQLLSADPLATGALDGEP